MKNLQTLLTSVAAEYCVPTEEVTTGIRAFFEHLMQDPEFRAAWEDVPKPDSISEEELLLALMIAAPHTEA